MEGDYGVTHLLRSEVGLTLISYAFVCFELKSGWN